jgi:hypothetical protein
VWREYEVLEFCGGEGIEDFAMRLTGMVNQLVMLGDLEPDDTVILKFLCITRPRFKQLVISIETLLDVSTLSLEEVTDRLRSAEEDGVAPLVAEGKIYLTEQEWVERSKKKDVDGGSSSGGGHGRGGSGRGRGRGRGGRDDGAGSSGEKGSYHRCGKPGHWAQDCRSKQPKKEKEKQAFTTQEESTLLFVEVKSVVLSDPRRSGGGERISGGDVGLGVRDQGSRCVGGKDSGPAGPRVLEQGEQLRPRRCRAPMASLAERRRLCTSLRKKCLRRSVERRSRNPTGVCWTSTPQTICRGAERRSPASMVGSLAMSSSLMVSGEYRGCRHHSLQVQD